MALATARWTCTPYSTPAAERLVSALGVSRELATILVRRGYDTPEAASGHLAAGERHDPSMFAAMDRACELILAHVRGGRRIVVHGDYDVDGVCSTAILIRVLRRLGADPGWHIPSRDDGYGLSNLTVERLAGEGASLIVTADCAIGSCAEVARARELGVDVVVTDHHRPGAAVPDCPVIHPGLCGYPFEHLCAAGVSRKLAESLLLAAGLDPAAAEDDADLVALATVADVVPLRGENRRLVREGLPAIARSRRPGLRALMRVAAVDPARVDEHALGFRLAPRINAAGRLARADAALELMLTENEARAARIAEELDQLNRERQDVETRILFAAEAARAEQPEAPVHVLAGQGWHPGLIGIVASRIVERYHRPCVMIGLADGRGRGSGRSIAAFDLHAGLTACADHLVRFGGHRAAAGLEIEADRVEEFRRAFVLHASSVLSPSDLVPTERIDAVVGPDRLGAGLAEELDRLRPFGHGNPAPTLLVPAARVGEVRGMGGEGEHSRFTIAGGGARASAVAFRVPASALPDSLEDRFDAAVRLELNEWNGMVEPRLVLRALCATEHGECRSIVTERTFLDRFERALEALGAPPLDRDGHGPRHSSTGSLGAPTAGAPRRRVRQVHDRRGEGFAGVAGDLISSGESVLVLCADAERRRAVLEDVIGGIVHAVADASAGAGERCPSLASWDEITLEPELAARFTHLVVLDPPALAEVEDLLAAVPPATEPPGGAIHLAWGPKEVEFALAVARRDLDLRPVVTGIYRRLRGQVGPAAGDALTAALRGDGPHLLPPPVCARAVTILAELELVSIVRVEEGLAVEAHSRPRTELGRSATYSRAVAQLADVRRRLGVPAPPARAA
ncbi:MAG: single-stranded-DNA-specific exonuclease RecJ [Actinobacteria bacterium]|nr:single-stranded-DNA-specific exonuclease RecJ [Actinomycetota bacterium]